MNMSAETAPPREVLTVSQLNRAARATLEKDFPLLWVEGEISNLARPSSGHLYFSLKDDQAQVRCAMFRQRNMHLRFEPSNGMHILARARVTMYEPRGDFQLVVEHMEQAGDGALRRAFDQLKAKLQGEGLFDAARKRSIPTAPHCVGVVTSPSGAAIRDILTILRRRSPAIQVIVYPVPVQGTGAGRRIATAIHHANERAECDVLIVGRGGGSLEDLWAFNEEVVARAIYGSPIPVVSAVGHEIDFTIADFVADVRAPTPSAAAELVSPDRGEQRKRLARLDSRLYQRMLGVVQRKNQALLWFERRLKHPGRRLLEIAQRLDELEQRLRNAHRAWWRHAVARLAALTARLHRHTPEHRIASLSARRSELARRLGVAVGRQQERRGDQLASAARALDMVSPLATLGRGYAIVERLDGVVVRDAQEVSTGDKVETRLAKGRLLCQVEAKVGDDNK